MPRQSLGEFEMLVLLAVLRLGEEEAHAVGIVDEIRERAGRKVRRAAVYIALQRLEQKGWVSTRLGEARPERGGKARRLVRLEAEGLAALQDSHRALSGMWRGLEADLETGP